VTRFCVTRIEPPAWADRPIISVTDLTRAEYAALRNHRDEMLRVVHHEVEDYLNTPGLYDEGKGFPDRLRMTGAYYLGDLSYWAHRDPTWIQISVMCRCLEHPRPRVDRQDDYLGLEVWLKCVPDRWSTFDVYRNTDSSSI
jgi:hypothetical protein